MGQQTTPPRWKVWVLTVAGLYPVLLLLVIAVGSLVPNWPMFARLAVIAPIAVAWIVWGFARTQRAILRRWH